MKCIFSSSPSGKEQEPQSWKVRFWKKTRRNAAIFCWTWRKNNPGNSDIGKEEEVLLEEKKEIQGREYWIGHTREYVKVAYPSDEDCRNKLVFGRIESALNDEILLLSTKGTTFH